MRLLFLLCFTVAAFGASIEKNTEEIDQIPSKRSPPSTFIHQSPQQLITQPHGGGFAPSQSNAAVEPTYEDPHQLVYGGDVQAIQGYSSPLPVSQQHGVTFQLFLAQRIGSAQHTLGYGSQDHNQANLERLPHIGSPTICPDGQIPHIDVTCIYPDVNQNVFVYRQPKEEAQYHPPPYVPKPKLKKNVIVISTTDPQQPETIVAPPPQQDTVVYVLNERKETRPQLLIPDSLPPKPPKVVFLSHKRNEPPELPHGSDLKNAFSHLSNPRNQAPPVTYLRSYQEHATLAAEGYNLHNTINDYLYQL